jgi:type III secretory pathway component EscU
MPSKLFSDIGLNQKQAFSAHMFLYGTPILTVLQVDTVSLFDEFMHSPFGMFEKRIFHDYDFLFGLMALVVLDSLVGGLGAVFTYEKNKDGSYFISPEGVRKRMFSSVVLYEKMSKKLFGIAVAVLCIGILKNTVISGEENLMAMIIDSGFYSVMLGFEGASVLKNCYKIYPWEPIKFALQKLEIFYNKDTNKIQD